MKILVIGGMHGNEMLGIDLVKSYRKIRWKILTAYWRMRKL